MSRQRHLRKQARLTLSCFDTSFSFKNVWEPSICIATHYCVCS